MLVSSSPGFVIEPLSIYLGCTDTLTTPVVVERGRLVSVGSGPPCYGEGKRCLADEWARVHRVRMEDAVAYADNWSDRALLAEVGRAVVVHPAGAFYDWPGLAGGTSCDRAGLAGTSELPRIP